MIFSLLIINFISNNPGITAAFIGLLLTGLFTLVGTYWAMISRRLDKLEATDEGISKRVQDVEETLVQYKEKVGAGETMFQSLTSGIHNLSTKMGVMHEDNLKAHTLIVERLARVETKLPNGQLQEVLDIVKGLASGR
jgi:hypothetical protein